MSVLAQTQHNPPGLMGWAQPVESQDRQAIALENAVGSGYSSAVAGLMPTDLSGRQLEDLVSHCRWE